METVKSPKVPERVIQPVAPDDIRKLLAQCGGVAAHIKASPADHLAARMNAESMGK